MNRQVVHGLCMYVCDLLRYANPSKPTISTPRISFINQYQNLKPLDRKLARENIGLSLKISKELNHKDFKHADKDVQQSIKNLRHIHNEIKSGKARRER